MKKSIQKIPLIYPLPLTIVGVDTKEKVYYTTVSNLTVLSDQPPRIGVMIDQKRLIRKQLYVGKTLSLNFPSTTMLDKADLCAHVTNLEFDKAILFNTHYNYNTPYISECPVSLIVQVTQEVKISKHYFYICDVIRTLVEDTLIIDQNIPSMNILDPIIYGLDGKYYHIGKVIGKASLEGKNLYRKLKKKQAPKPYSFQFKLKICKLKDQGKSYKSLAKEYQVYHETIEDWYMLYTFYGKEGLTKATAQKLAQSKFTENEKALIISKIKTQEITYKEAVLKYNVSLSRLKNWVKKSRRK